MNGMIFFFSFTIFLIISYISDKIAYKYLKHHLYGSYSNQIILSILMAYIFAVAMAYNL